jgi:hypothetical protein
MVQQSLPLNSIWHQLKEPRNYFGFAVQRTGQDRDANRKPTPGPSVCADGFFMRSIVYGWPVVATTVLGSNKPFGVNVASVSMCD